MLVALDMPKRKSVNESGAIQETPDIVIWAYSERTFSENRCGGRKVERRILSSFEFWDSDTAFYGACF